MAHPRHKISHSKQGKRRSHHAIEVRGIGVCSNCGASVRLHHVCTECGYYRGQVVISESISPD